MGLCQFKDMFGKPGEGAHRYRVFNIAIVDLALTVVMAFAIAKWKKWNPIQVLLVLLVLSVIVHKMFCVKTTLSNF